MNSRQQIAKEQETRYSVNNAYDRNKPNFCQNFSD